MLLELPKFTLHYKNENAHGMHVDKQIPGKGLKGRPLLTCQTKS